MWAAEGAIGDFRKKTPLAVLISTSISAHTMDRHTSRFLMIFLTATPVILWPAAQWSTPVIAAFIAFLWVLRLLLLVAN